MTGSGYARGGDNTTRRNSVGHDNDIVINIKCNGIEAERDTGTLMESVVWAIRNVAKNVECSHLMNKTNIPDLQSIFSVTGRERTGGFREPQRVSEITWETFRVYILRRVPHIVSSRVKSEADRWAKWTGAAAEPEPG